MKRYAVRRFSVISHLLAIFMILGLMGCFDNAVIDEISDEADARESGSLDQHNNAPAGDDVTGKIIVHQTGGIAGFSRKTSIIEEDDSVMLVYEDLVANQRKESPVLPEELDQLWQTLEENDVFTLPTNLKLLGTVYDGFFFEVTVSRGTKQNQFSVYCPDLLNGEGEARYIMIMKAIESFSDSHLKEGEEFVIADMPITDVSIEILESFPLQVHLVVTGYLRDGCTVLNEITQERRDNTVLVNITTKRPVGMDCIQVIKEVTERIPLESGFLPGVYKLVVNDYEKEFVIEDVAAGLD